MEVYGHHTPDPWTCRSGGPPTHVLVHEEGRQCPLQAVADGDEVLPIAAAQPLEEAGARDLAEAGLGLVGSRQDDDADVVREGEVGEVLVFGVGDDLFGLDPVGVEPRLEVLEGGGPEHFEVVAAREIAQRLVLEANVGDAVVAQGPRDAVRRRQEDARGDERAGAVDGAEGTPVEDERAHVVVGAVRRLSPGDAGRNLAVHRDARLDLGRAARGQDEGRQRGRHQQGTARSGADARTGAAPLHGDPAGDEGREPFDRGHGTSLEMPWTVAGAS
jgi:hypothetical protein